MNEERSDDEREGHDREHERATHADVVRGGDAIGNVDELSSLDSQGRITYHVDTHL